MTRLRREQVDGSFGVRFSTDGDQMPLGNVVIGVRNPIAPPLVVEQPGEAAADRHHHAAIPAPYPARSDA